LSKKPIHDTQVVLNINSNLYKGRSGGLSRLLPLMLPNLTYKVDIEVENTDPTGASDMITVFVIDQTSTVPLITANLQMPVSELNFD
jgi:hypothetical protein